MRTEARATAQEQAILGCLLGTAIGDAVGLACEGLPRRRQARLFPHLDGPHLLGRRGMVSDDTEHTCLVAQALIESGSDTDGFTHALARRLRWWLLGLPAGVGWATLRATLEALPRRAAVAERRSLGGQRPRHAERPAGRLLWGRS